MRWYGRATRRDEEYVGKRAMGVEVQGSGRRGRPKKRRADRVKDDLREKGLSGEEAYDRAARRRLSSQYRPHNYSEGEEDRRRGGRTLWKTIWERRDCRERRCTTELHGGDCRPTSTPQLFRRGRPKKRWADRVKDVLREKGLSGEEVYDRAAWRRLSSHIDPTIIQKERKTEEEVGGPCERRSEREGTVGRGGVRPSRTEATIIPHRPHNYSEGEEDRRRGGRTVWKTFRERRDCRERRRTTELHGGDCRPTSTPQLFRRRGRPKKRWADRVKDVLREKGLSGEEVYDWAARRRLSSHIDPTIIHERKTEEEAGGPCERRSEREGTVGRRGVRPSCTVVPHRPHIDVG